MPTYPKGNKFITKFMVAGARPSKITDTREEGEAWELSARAALKRGQPIPDLEQKKVGGRDARTVGGAVRSAISLHWDRLKNSAKQINNAELFVRWVGANTPAEEAFSPAKLREFYKYLIEERKVSNSTINRYSSALSIISRHADLKTKPEFNWYKTHQTRVRFFSPAEEHAVVRLFDQWGRDKYRDFFMFLIDTGLRPWEEGTKLKWENVHAKSITVHGKDRWRDVPLTKRAKAILDKQDRNEPGPFWGMNANIAGNLWDRVRSMIPALKDTVWYTTRHTFASRLVQQGVHLKAVADLMGNSTMIVDKVYAHLTPDHLGAAIEHLEKFGGGLSVVQGGMK